MTRFRLALPEATVRHLLAVAIPEAPRDLLVEVCRECGLPTDGPTGELRCRLVDFLDPPPPRRRQPRAQRRRRGGAG